METRLAVYIKKIVSYRYLVRVIERFTLIIRVKIDFEWQRLVFYAQLFRVLRLFDQ